VPVTVRGRGTSLTGSAAPARGGWVLDLHGWNRIRIDAQSGMAHVQAGATVGRIQAAAERKGWFYPPDPSSKKYCTIGGNIACNAGGMHGGKYGVTRDFVLALRGFLPTGEWVEWGTPTKKFSAGFNLRDLWIGSEGMLGIVTEATLKLIPKPSGALDAPRLLPDRARCVPGGRWRSSPCGCSRRSASSWTGTRSTARSARLERTSSRARRAAPSCSSSSPGARPRSASSGQPF
jgi:glycolate oxidase